jgi:hypothetical protein
MMIRFARRILLLAFLGTLSVPALAQYSSPMRDVENPARTPVRVLTSVNVAAMFGGSFGNPIYQVPAGKRLVIDFLSVICTSIDPIDSASLAVSEATGGGSATQRPQPLSLTPGPNDIYGNRTWTLSQPVTLYADSTAFGTQDVAFGLTKAGTAGPAACQVGFQGHTITL